MLNSIHATNFLSWKNLAFNVTKGATLIDGWNEDDQRSEGSGKSTVLNAISWCIFGKLPKDSNVDEVIKDGESSCSVTLEFDSGDLIVRSRKPNDLYILKAGVTVKGKDARETQTFIEEYIGCNFETFCQSVYFAQNYDKKFLSSNQEDKGKILSSIQNLQIFDKARKEVMDLLKFENDKITKLSNQVQIEDNNLSNLKSQKALIESFIQDKTKKHKQQISSMNQQKDLVSGHMKKTETDIEITNQKILTIDVESLIKDEVQLGQVKNQYVTQMSEISYQKSQVDSVTKLILSKETEGKNLAVKYNTLSQNLKSLNPTGTHRYKTLSANKDQILNLEQNSSRNRLLLKAKQLQDFIANPKKICPSCGTELKASDTNHAQKELEAISLEIEEISISVKKQADDILTQMDEEVAAIHKQSSEMAKEVSDILVQLGSISEYLDQTKVPSTEELSNKESEIKGLISQIDQALFQISQKKFEHSQLVNKLGSLSNQLTSYSQQYEQYIQAITQLGEPDISQDNLKLECINQELSQISVKLTELRQLLETSGTHLGRLELLKDGFKDIKSYVFVNALNELNYRTNHYLNELFEMEASIKFTSEDQKINSKIVVDGHERGLGLLSGGQNRRFNLAVDLALADIVSYRKTSKLDLIIFDEYFRDLSEISMEKCLELLKTRKCPVILIEHNSIFKNIVDNVFFVKLEDGTSYESRQ